MYQTGLKYVICGIEVQENLRSPDGFTLALAQCRCLECGGALDRDDVLRWSDGGQVFEVVLCRACILRRVASAS